MYKNLFQWNGIVLLCHIYTQNHGYGLTISVSHETKTLSTITRAFSICHWNMNEILWLRHAQNCEGMIKVSGWGRNNALAWHSILALYTPLYRNCWWCGYGYGSAANESELLHLRWMFSILAKVYNAGKDIVGLLVSPTSLLKMWPSFRLTTVVRTWTVSIEHTV